MKRKWDKLTAEQRIEAQNDLIYFFESERDEKIGVIAAGQMLDFFLEHVGPKIYNRGIEDAKKALEERLSEFNYDLDELNLD
jgi:uncharacterized protein (DUF2164 family)